MKSGIIITLHNKEKEINTKVFKQFFDVWKDIHICLVNNGSTDGTLDVIHSLKENFVGRLSVVSIRNKKEYEAALKLGFRYLTNKYSLANISCSSQIKLNELNILSEISTKFTND